MATCDVYMFAAGAITAVLGIGFVFLSNFFTQTLKNEVLVEEIRPSLVDHQLKQYSVHILTWNVGGKKSKNVEKILPLLGITKTFKPDIIAIGIQEITEIGINFDTIFSSPKWADTIEDELFPRNYIRIGFLRNKAMNLFVYALQDHWEFIRNANRMEKRINPSSQNFTHKSGQSIRFQFYRISLAFTNVHMNAGQNRIDDRIHNYQAIVNEPFSDQIYLLDHDYHFWFGDLNFRIKDLPAQTILDRIDLIRQSKGTEEGKKLIDNLLAHDELKRVMQRSTAFREYSEPEITFLPTYKFYPFTDEYDLHRNPSYCDRILYKTLPENNCKQLELINIRYDADSINRMSDHRPVTALYLIKA